MVPHTLLKLMQLCNPYMLDRLHNINALQILCLVCGFGILLGLLAFFCTDRKEVTAHTVLPRIFVYTTVHNADRELDRIALIKVASKLTGLQRQLDIARSTDAGDNSLTSWQEALLLGLVGASYEAHELTHRVAVVVWRPEGMLCNSPPWREDHKVCHRRACTSGVAVLSAAAAAAAAAADWQKQ